MEKKPVLTKETLDKFRKTTKQQSEAVAVVTGDLVKVQPKKIKP